MVSQRPGLRPVREADRAFLISLYRETRDDLAALPLPPAALTQMLVMQFDAQAQSYERGFPGHHWDIILHRDTPVGQIRVLRGTDEFVAIDLSLLAASRGRGIGSHLLRNLQQEARTAGLPLKLSVEHRNTRARALYDRLGFVAVKDLGAHLAMCWPSTARP
ncbi:MULTISPECIES: GNAT family N-acetyltransferase [unclassified Mameliella]|uniref:GNAT family N-acetyltransferase n=1 Tax=unclassified Mameliella TaxID=2630630 RepID=UPI00273CF4F8|nr:MULTISPECIES: GNAT family N-acetyltransferase [unclassified Mameliella]